MENPPLVVAVILNTNRREDTLACLDSLSANNYPNLQVIVLDNASTDGSVDAIHTNHPQVQVLSLSENLGYAGNNNVGIDAAINRGAEWVFVLNEDTILAPDAISVLIAYAQQNPTCGVAGPLVYHFNEPEIVQSAGGILSPRWVAYHAGQNEPDHGQYQQPCNVDWISGCAILMRRELIEQVGKLDERFFYYWEETEWCIRARKAGWQITLVPQAKIWHKGVQRNYQPGPNVTYYWTRNWLMALAKHRAPIGIRLAAYGSLFRTLASWTLRPKWSHKRPHRDAMWQGLIDFFNHRTGMRAIQK